MRNELFEREWREFTISTALARLDIELIHEFLKNSYWAAAIPRSLVEKSLRNSLCFGVYQAARQLGFARVITDYATFAYLADVFIVPEMRGQGLSKFLMQAIMEHPELQGLRRWMLATRDAHGLYQQYGFTPLKSPQSFMEIARPDIYQKPDPE